jgi:hypothetical protein
MAAGYVVQQRHFLAVADQPRFIPETADVENVTVQFISGHQRKLPIPQGT